MVTKKSSTTTSRKPDNPPGTQALLVWGVPKETKRKFKAKCATNGVRIKDVIMDLMQGYINA